MQGLYQNDSLGQGRRGILLAIGNFEHIDM